MRLLKLTPILILSTSFSNSAQQLVKVEQVELQPLTARVKRLIEATDYPGAPFTAADKQALERASSEMDAVPVWREIRMSERQSKKLRQMLQC